MGLYDDVYAALEDAGVRYVVVGGVAVVLSGHVRATVDLDLVVDLEPEAAARAMRALERLGLLPRVPVAPQDFADPDLRASWIRDKHMQVLSFFDPHHPAREVDVSVTYPSHGTPVMADPWSRATFAGTEQAQADHIADLTPDERVALLEQLLDIAEASGALRRARQDKQRDLDRAWGPEKRG